jgi:hypothetical protein
LSEAARPEILPQEQAKEVVVEEVFEVERPVV